MAGQPVRVHREKTNKYKYVNESIDLIRESVWSPKKMKSFLGTGVEQREFNDLHVNHFPCRMHDTSTPFPPSKSVKNVEV